MTESEILNEVMAEVMTRLKAAATKDERECVLSAYAMVAYKFMRPVLGDEFTRGWLESAVAEVKTNPSELTMVTLQ